MAPERGHNDHSIQLKLATIMNLLFVVGLAVLGLASSSFGKDGKYKSIPLDQGGLWDIVHASVFYYNAQNNSPHIFDANHIYYAERNLDNGIHYHIVVQYAQTECDKPKKDTPILCNVIKTGIRNKVRVEADIGLFGGFEFKSFTDLDEIHFQ